MQTKPVEWSKNATIYEVNIRQYTPEGTINAFAEHLPELKKLGVEILWLMPIYPIGEENRKGGMGSAYSVKDYRAVNPDYGTMDDLKNLVKKAHESGMYVILDWVANHTAWDNDLVKEHTDWYLKDSLGNFVPPVPDWADVIDLNYDNPEVRNYMTNSMKFWIENADVDGFRCDVAGMVPTDFWDTTRAELDSLKPVFMLAEAEQPDLTVKAFDMYYGWELYHLMNEIAQGKKSVIDLDKYFQKQDTVYSSDDYRMNFTTNHDENSWNGTVKERLGDAAQTMAVLTYAVPGMPLIYSGQEAGLDKRLSFFDKDTIQWKDSPYRELYTKLDQLKKDNAALWNGDFGGKMTRIQTNSDDNVFAIEREKDSNTVVAIFNMSNKEQVVSITDDIESLTLKDYFSGEEVEIEEGSQFTLEPWGYLVLTEK
ncbi:MAG: alpha-glucosidase C-terminal domain-containing protein [Cyclobacteriaceae bacterium]|nr:alpha-glucosidase C-terminal domain-containing protein [Cyclobacteriaceae bacterium]